MTWKELTICGPCFSPGPVHVGEKDEPSLLLKCALGTTQPKSSGSSRHTHAHSPYPTALLHSVAFSPSVVKVTQGNGRGPGSVVAPGARVMFCYSDMSGQGFSAPDFASPASSSVVSLCLCVLQRVSFMEKPLLCSPRLQPPLATDTRSHSTGPLTHTLTPP